MIGMPAPGTASPHSGWGARFHRICVLIYQWRAHLCRGRCGWPAAEKSSRDAYGGWQLDRSHWRRPCACKHWS
eukprot:scaffold7095_cov386-Prasinococcus_capsulatus_cf.AAC.10